MMHKTLIFLFLLLGGFSVHASKADPAIVKTTSPQGWRIQTENSCYQIVVDKTGKVKTAFYGAAAQGTYGKKNASWYDWLDEVPARGGAADKLNVLEVVFADGVRDADLKYVSSEIFMIDGRPTLKIVQKDSFYSLQVTSFIRVLPEFDILEKWNEIKNSGSKENIKVENAHSSSIVLPRGDYILDHKTGKWAHEFQPVRTELTPGVKTLGATDFKSLSTPPWYLVRPKGDEMEGSGTGWFGTIAYTGNWSIQFEKYYDGNVQITGGINFWDSEWNLRPGEIFTTPKFISGYTIKGEEGAAQAMAAFVREEVLPKAHSKKMRPVLYNSWYATYFDVNEPQQLALAKKAKEMGVEMFVIDDGWFTGRTTDKAGLGDWTPDKTKFPNGLQPLIKKINDMGMDFGIWIEPEMVNPNSALYRAHPDWVLNFPNRPRTERRNQLTLNLANNEVYQYLLNAFTRLLSENNIKYVKWDHNRAMTEPGWPDAPEGQQREVRVRYIRNLYSLIDQLRKKFPDVWFENCSSGGGRLDLGMMERTDMSWVSDNTDPLDRIMIQYSYLSAYPANTMISWVTHENNHQPMPLAYKFDVSMSGVLGVGNDITKFTEAEHAIAAEKIAQYKRIRPLVQQGVLSRLVSPFEGNRSALQYTSEKADTSVLFCYNLGEYLPGSKGSLVKLKGLLPGGKYEIEKLGLPEGQQSREVYSGEFLMQVGIAWPLSGANKSQILLFKSVGK